MNKFLGLALGFGIIFVPLIGACAGMGLGYRSKIDLVAGEVTPDRLDDRSAVVDDAYVSTTAAVRLHQKGDLPIGDHTVIRSDGGVLYRLAGSERILVYCKDEDCAELERPTASGGNAHVAGRVCAGETTFFGCRLPSGYSIYLRHEEKRRGLPEHSLRVLVVGATPAEPRNWSYFAFGWAAFDFLAWAGIVVGIGLRRRTLPPTSLERTFVLAVPPTEIGRILEQGMANVDGFRIEKADATGIVFAQGPTPGHAQLMGMTRPEDVPRGGVLTWTSSGRPYDPVTLRVRLEDRVTWLGNVPQLDGFLREALARSAGQLERIFRA